jgi:hypothetical protein
MSISSPVVGCVVAKQSDATHTREIRKLAVPLDVLLFSAPLRIRACLAAHVAPSGETPLDFVG